MTDELAYYPDNFATKCQFDDFDAFTEASYQWDLEFNQLDKGEFNASLNQVVSGGVSVSECRFNRKLLQKGDSPSNAWTFGVPADPQMHYRWRGQSVESHDVIAFESGVELDSVSETGFHIYAVSVADDLLESLCEAEEWKALKEIVGHAGKIECDPGTIAKLRSGAREVLSHTDKLSFGMMPLDGRATESARGLSNSILQAFQEAGDQSKRREPSLKVRSQALERALAVIHDRAHEPVGMEELYEASEASGRTLRYAFEERFGMSPKAYLQAHRLNQVKRELSGGDLVKGIQVSDVANAWGFWHMGQFASDYRRMFRELPSDTLKRS